MVNNYFYSISVTIVKFHWLAASSWYKKELSFGRKRKRQNAKNLKIKCQQRWVKPKCSIDKKTKTPILYQFHDKNLNTGMYFYLSTIISRKKFALVNLFLIT